MVVASNPKRRRKSSRRRRRNPSMSLKRPLGALTSGFKPKSALDVLPIAGGAIANFWASGMVGSYILPKIDNQMLKTVASYGIGIGLAGLSTLVPKYGAKLFMGGMVFQTLRVINSFLPGDVRLSGYMDGDGDGDMDSFGMRGMRELIERPGMSELIWNKDAAVVLE